MFRTLLRTHLSAPVVAIDPNPGSVKREGHHFLSCAFQTKSHAAVAAFGNANDSIWNLKSFSFTPLQEMKLFTVTTRNHDVVRMTCVEVLKGSHKFFLGSSHPGMRFILRIRIQTNPFYVPLLDSVETGHINKSLKY